MKRFRSVEEIPRVWFVPGDPKLYRAIAAVWDLGHRTLRPHFPPGVYKHRSIEEQNRQDEEWAAANFRAFWERRKKAASAG